MMHKNASFYFILKNFECLLNSFLYLCSEWGLSQYEVTYDSRIEVEKISYML